MARSEEPLLGLVGKALRADYEDTTRQALPKRWVDLLLYLDEQEAELAAFRQADRRPKPPARSGKPAMS